jgi:Gluconate 2-dehydrogenase subunit 3
MERREALRLLATAAAIPLVPGEMSALLRAARVEAQSGGTLRTLNPQQNALVVRMAEIILPETKTPGATTARVNEFIDLILTEWYSPEERDHFLAGLADVDARSRARFGKDFVALAVDQQTAIVKDLDLEMVADSVAEDRAHSDRGSHHHGSQLFFASMKQLTLTGYFTSEVGATDELHFQIIPGHYDACVPADANEASK